MAEKRLYYVKHLVVAGENLTRIAQTYKTTVQDIVEMNRIIQNPSLIQAGWVLNVPDNR